MQERMWCTPFLIFLSGASIFGLATVLMLAISPPINQESLPIRKPLVGSTFMLICVAGVAATLSPRRCMAIIALGEAEKPHTIRGCGRVSKGHHPNCESFSNHVIGVKGVDLCAACTGLLTGAILSMGGAASYFFAGWNPHDTGLLTVLVGEAGIVLGILQFEFKGYARLCANAFFVVGAMLVLVGVDTLSNNLLVDFYALGLILFVLFVRILISKQNNSRICHSCQLRGQ